MAFAAVLLLGGDFPPLEVRAVPQPAVASAPTRQGQQPSLTKVTVQFRDLPPVARAAIAGVGGVFDSSRVTATQGALHPILVNASRGTLVVATTTGGHLVASIMVLPGSTGSVTISPQSTAHALVRMVLLGSERKRPEVLSQEDAFIRAHAAWPRLVASVVKGMEARQDVSDMTAAMAIADEIGIDTMRKFMR